MKDSPLLRACRGEPADHTPVWFMRQAGRYLPAYRALRERHSMMEMIDSPELAAEATLLPFGEIAFDAAIIFADILPPLRGMGLEISFEGEGGPRIGNPLRSSRDIDLLAAPPAEETVGATLAAIRLAAAELGPRGVPLIGFAGAPFTLASYAVEGGGSRTYERVKTLMYREPAAWKRLMTRLVTVQADSLVAQAEAGASALQVFDSWVGLALGPADYERCVAPYNRLLFEKVGRAGVPVISFSTGTAGYLREVAACGGDVVSVDWRVTLDRARDLIGGRPVQGNLDPTALLAPWRELRSRIDDVLDRAAGAPGHVFNLGHGVLPGTPVDNVRRAVDYVHERTAAEREVHEAGEAARSA